MDSATPRRLSVRTIPALVLVVLFGPSNALADVLQECISRSVSFARYDTVTGENGSRAYLHHDYPESCPSPENTSCKSSAYLIPGDHVAVAKTCGGWAYVRFFGKRPPAIRGWVSASSLGAPHGEPGLVAAGAWAPQWPPPREISQPTRPADSSMTSPLDRLQGSWYSRGWKQEPHGFDIRDGKIWFAKNPACRWLPITVIEDEVSLDKSGRQITIELHDLGKPGGCSAGPVMTFAMDYRDPVDADTEPSCSASIKFFVSRHQWQSRDSVQILEYGCGKSRDD
jgi:hypothetical protein